jgi:Cytochrome c554 and c-prime
MVFREEHSRGRPIHPITLKFLEWFAVAIFASIEGVVRSVVCWLCAIVFVVAWAPSSSAGEVKVEPISDRQFVGAVGCKSSSCHGGAGEKRDQYLTWSQKDFHTRAYAILTNARSARIAETLGVTRAQESSRCTVCHSPFQSVAPARLTQNAHPDEGVSCESCHGAAGSWLRGHTRKDWNYAMRVTAGMRDLKSFYVRANTCVACHQNLDSDIAKAGHPELTFELDGQSVAEPKHWRDDAPSSGMRAWLVGQAVALREMSWELSKNETPDAETIAKWKGLAWLLAKATAHQTALPVIDPPSEITSRALFASAQEQADLLARQAAEYQFSGDFAMKVLHALVTADSEFAISKETTPDVLFRRAQRLVLALDRLSNAVNSHAPETAKNPELSRLFDDLRSQADFQGPRFAEHLASFRATIRSSLR